MADIALSRGVRREGGVRNNRETAMDRNQKAEAVEALSSVFDQAGSVILTHYSGLSVAEMTKLRGELRESGATLKVIKNRLAKIALKGKPGEGAVDMFQGPVAIAYAEDVVSAPKGLVKYAKDNDKLKIVGGFMGDEVLDANGVEALSKMPSREEIIATIAARLTGQASQIGQRIGGPGGKLASQIEDEEAGDGQEFGNGRADGGADRGRGVCAADDARHDDRRRRFRDRRHWRTGERLITLVILRIRTDSLLIERKHTWLT